jgi:pSer/pThr/pTyr-binding forkhead associated (FHA) protein
VVNSELALPAKTEFGAGSMTKRISTRRLESTARTSLQPTVAVAAAEAGAFATVEYEDNGGRKTFSITKNEIVVGRGGRDYWTDLKLDTLPDVSREHLRLRRDPESGRFFLKDLSRLGTTIDGQPVPSSIEVVEGEKRDRNLETPVPDRARIGLAGVLFLEFRNGSTPAGEG